MVWDKGFLGVVADKEWDAIQAAQEAQGRVVAASSRRSPIRPRSTTTSARPAYASAASKKRTAMSTRRSRPPRKVIEAEYEWPFQSHASMGPACALVEIKDGNGRPAGRARRSRTFVQQGLAVDARRAARQASASSGRPGPAPTAATMPTTAPWMRPCWRKPSASRSVLQYMRDEGTGWDPKGPASVHKRARGDRRRPARSPAYEFMSKAFSRVDVDTNGNKPFDTLAGQTRGSDLKSGDGFGIPAESYAFDNKRAGWETIPPLLDRFIAVAHVAPARSGRDRRSTSPARSFIDEVAAALECRSDRIPAAPCQGTARHRTAQGALPKNPAGSRGHRRGAIRPANKVSGRGLAYSQRNGTRVAIVAEVDIDRSTGKICARKFTVAHDCGQIINPDGLVKCIEGNIVQGVQPHAVGGSHLRPQGGDQRRLDHLPDPRHHRDARAR